MQTSFRVRTDSGSLIAPQQFGVHPLADEFEEESAVPACWLLFSYRIFLHTVIARMDLYHLPLRFILQRRFAGDDDGVSARAGCGGGRVPPKPPTTLQAVRARLGGERVVRALGGRAREPGDVAPCTVRRYDPRSLFAFLCE